MFVYNSIENNNHGDDNRIHVSNTEPPKYPWVIEIIV